MHCKIIFVSFSVFLLSCILYTDVCNTTIIIIPFSNKLTKKLQKNFVLSTNFYLEAIILTTKVTCGSRDLNVNPSVFSEIARYTQTPY